MTALTLRPDAPDRPGFAARINEAWRSARDNIFAAGRALVEAKASLPHGEFTAMAENDLPFSRQTAYRLMRIAEDTRLTNVTHVQHLPPSWGTLYELAQIEDDTAFAAAIRDGVIRPDMERADARRLRTRTAHPGRLARVEALAAARVPPLEEYAAGRSWAVLYADPPWAHETWSGKGQEKSPGNHYPTMTPDAIAALPVGALAADDAVLFLWTTGNRIGIAVDVMRGWGFAQKSKITWRKTDADGGLHRGTGHWVRDCDELLLICTRGNPPAPPPGTQADGSIDASVGRHSEKPEIFRGIIDRYYPGVRKLELFRRGDAPEGWDVWGNEAGAPDTAAAEGGG